jgi:hypothetical protein
VHLAGESDGGDGFGCEAGGLESFANRQCGGAPPVARILLRPAGFGTGEVGVLFRARRKDCAVFVEKDGAGSAGSDVDAEDGDTVSFLGPSCAQICPKRGFRYAIGERENYQANQGYAAA